VGENTSRYVHYEKCGFRFEIPKGETSSLDALLPEDQFWMYAVCTRDPQKLAGAADLRPVQAGVYDCWRGTDMIARPPTGE
jgi:hypothetical protein